MSRVTRLSFSAAFAIVLLRMAIGFHFYKEGEAKLMDKNWSSEGFFLQAKGELAPFYKGLLADPDARFQLCYDPFEEDGTNPEATFDEWKQFGHEIAARCRRLEAAIEARRNSLRDEIGRLRSAGQDVADLEAKYDEDEQKILELRKQVEEIGPILQRHMDEFEKFLIAYEVEIRDYFRSLARLDGFKRDGEVRGDVVEGVDSLYGQQAKIKSDIMKERAPLVAQVDAAWDALEMDLTDVDVEEFQDDKPVLVKPYEQRDLMKFVDWIVPYHHVVIGCLIFIGLLCRPASLLGAFFLLMICATQLPWATGAQPIYYQVVEMLALLSLAAIGAGRYGGLDYFFAFFARSRTSNQEG